MILFSHQIISYLLPVIASYLSYLFTLILHHGYMPKALHDCLLILIPKPNKDPSLSDSYRPIALAPNLSKVLQSCILIQYQNCPTISDLQFGSSEVTARACTTQTISFNCSFTMCSMLVATVECSCLMFNGITAKLCRCYFTVPCHL